MGSRGLIPTSPRGRPNLAEQRPLSWGESDLDLASKGGEGAAAAFPVIHTKRGELDPAAGE